MMIISRRTSLALCALTGLAFALPTLGRLAPALAATIDNAPQPYTPDAFAAAQKAGKPILVETYATWCDVCARQMPILDTLRHEPKYRDLVSFKVDFDTQKDVMRKFNARVQSTLIAYRGDKEVGRSVGETQPEWIDDLLQKTLGQGGS